MKSILCIRIGTMYGMRFKEWNLEGGNEMNTVLSISSPSFLYIPTK